MDQAIAMQNDFERRIDVDEAGNEEVIGAFDHVLLALDQVILLAELARPKGLEAARR